MIRNILHTLGEKGPVLLLLITIYLLWNKNVLLFYFLLGTTVNNIINIILKGIIKQPRPSVNNKSIALKKYYTYVHTNHAYGMPSGHSQNALFSSAFIFASLKSVNISGFYCLLSIITLIQRVQYNHHTVLQVVCGSILGLVFGYIFYTMSQRKLQGKRGNNEGNNSIIIYQ